MRLWPAPRLSVCLPPHRPVRLLGALGLIQVLLSTVLASVSLVRAQAPNITATADSLVSGERNGLPIEQMIGHVQFVQGSLYGSADRAVRYTTANRIELEGNVQIHQDTLSLYAPTVSYDGTTGIGHAEGGVTLMDRDVTLKAATGDYDMPNQVAYFHTNVTITQGRSSSRSDNLTYYRGTQTSVLVGHAVVNSDSGTLQANRITYARAIGETIAEGAVQVMNDTMRLVSDWMYNSQPLGELFARGHVNVEDLKGHTVLYGDTLARFAKQGYSIVPLHPLLLSIDSSEVRDSITGRTTTVFDTMFISARTMEIYQGDSSRFVATDSVRLLRSGFGGIGGKLIYDQKHDVMRFFQAQRQRLWYDSTEIDADSVALLLPNRHVDRVFAVGHAFATSPVAEFPNSGRIDQLQGERMTLFVERDTVRTLYDMSNALTIYYIIQDNKPGGLERASGDTIRIDFHNRTVARVAVLSGTEGEHFPERFVTGRAQAFRLASYERHPELRPRREQFVIPWMVPARPSMSPMPSPAPKPKRRSPSQTP